MNKCSKQENILKPPQIKATVTVALMYIAKCRVSGQ